MATAVLSRAIKNAAAMMRAVEFGDSSIPPNSQAGGVRGSMMGGEQSALAIATVLACVKALYEDFTVLPFGAYTGDRNGAYSLIKQQPQIVTEPFGPDLDPAIGFGQLVVSRTMRGNGYLFVTERDNMGYPTLLTILHPDKVKPDRDQTTGQKFFRVGVEKYSTSQILHYSGLMLPGAVMGVDLLTYQRTTHDSAWRVAAYADKLFANSAMPGGIINVPGAGDRKRAREVKEAWEDSHAGIENAHRPAVLFGDAKFQPLSITPENAQFLQTRQYQREELCGIYNVPLARIQAVPVQDPGAKGLDASDAEYVRHGLLPPATGLETIWNKLVPGDLATFTRFDFDVFLRASALTRAQIAQIHRVAAIREIDEIRGDEGWAPLPNGQGATAFAPLNSNTASPAGGASNAPDAAPPSNGGFPA